MLHVPLLTPYKWLGGHEGPLKQRGVPHAAGERVGATRFTLMPCATALGGLEKALPVLLPTVGVVGQRKVVLGGEMAPQGKA